jgi:hypothetical protein
VLPIKTAGYERESKTNAFAAFEKDRRSKIVLREAKIEIAMLTAEKTQGQEARIRSTASRALL